MPWEKKSEHEASAFTFLISEDQHDLMIIFDQQPQFP